MEEKVIGIRKKENINRGIFGEFARKEAEVFFEGGTCDKKTCFLDEKTALSYIKRYQQYLSQSKWKIYINSYLKTLKKRIKYNLYALPIYLLGTFLLFSPQIFQVTAEGSFLLLFYGGMGVCLSGLLLANKNSNFITSSKQKKLQELKTKEEEAQNLELEILKEIDGKEEADLQRARIVHQALLRKTELERMPKYEELKQHKEKMKAFIRKTNWETYEDWMTVSDVPEYLRRKR